jgi:hypothetical protein
MLNNKGEWEVEPRVHRHSNWKEFGHFVGWALIGFGATKLAQWALAGWVEPNTIIAFVLGAMCCFIILTIYGKTLQYRRDKERQSAMNQFIDDQKQDQEKQAKIDQEIINQLKHEHELSGTEQDQRLRALEQALKHLKGKSKR